MQEKEKEEEFENVKGKGGKNSEYLQFSEIDGIICWLNKFGERIKTTIIFLQPINEENRIGSVFLAAIFQGGRETIGEPETKRKF